MNNNVLLQAMALDFKRVAMAYHSGSYEMANRFLKEVFMRKKQLNLSLLQPTLKKLIGDIDKIFSQTNTRKLADDALMYSTLLISFSKKS